MNELANFILENIPYYRQWDRGILDSWLNWYVVQGLVTRAFDLDNSLAGIAMVRTIMRPQDAEDHYAFDPEGEVAFVEVFIAVKPRVMQALALGCLERFGHRPWVAWRRPPYYITKFRETGRVLNHVLGRISNGRE